MCRRTLEHSSKPRPAAHTGASVTFGLRGSSGEAELVNSSSGIGYRNPHGSSVVSHSALRSSGATRLRRLERLYLILLMC